MSVYLPDDRRVIDPATSNLFFPLPATNSTKNEQKPSSL